MTQDTENPATIPPLPDQLKIRLRDSLSNYGECAPEDVMNEQASILDRAFRHLIERGAHYGDTPRFTAALKAQNSTASRSRS